MTENYLKKVRDQYEDLPYPHRDPRTEFKRICYTTCDSLDRLNHYCFGAKRDFRNDFRVLIAGGGTGDAAIFLGEQLRGTRAEIVYLDISTASMEVAKSRAAIRELDNITWVHNSLLDVAELDLGTFDFISCTGVLHHLEDPSAGLKALEAVLKPGGVMGIMVYGQIGRTGVYQMQEALRLLTRDVDDKREKIKLARAAMETLPKGAWYQHNNVIFASSRKDDTEFYDLLLHPQDRAYTVPQLYDWLEGAGLDIVHLFSREHPQGNRLYDPRGYIKDPEAREQVSKLSIREQQALAELLHGEIRCHVFYAMREVPSVASLDDPDMVPSFAISYLSSGKIEGEPLEAIKNAEETITFMNDITRRGVKFKATPNAYAIIKHIDSRKTVREIIAAVQSEAGEKYPPSADMLMQELQHIYNAFRIQDWIFVRHKDVPMYKRWPQMQGHMKEKLKDMKASQALVS